MTVSEFQGEVLPHFFGFSLSLYILTSPSAQNREQSVSIGRRFLPLLLGRPLGAKTALRRESLHMFSLRNKKNYLRFILKTPPYLEL